MPKVLTEVQRYMLRVTYAPNYKKDVNFKEVQKQFHKELYQIIKGDDCCDFICCEHNGKSNNLHAHYVISIKMSQPTLREIIKKYFVPKSYSLKKVINYGDELYSYLFHERDDCIIVSHNIRTEDLERYRRLNQEIQEERRDGGSKYKLVNDIISQYKALINDKKQLKKMRDPGSLHIVGGGEETLHLSLHWPRHKILAWLIYKYYDEGWFPSKFQMERYILTIERQLHKNDNTEFEGFEELYKNYFC